MDNYIKSAMSFSSTSDVGINNEQAIIERILQAVYEDLCLSSEPYKIFSKYKKQKRELEMGYEEGLCAWAHSQNLDVHSVWDKKDD